MADEASEIGKPVRESVTAWCKECGGSSFMAPGIEDPDDAGLEIRTCEEGHTIRTTRYVYSTAAEATRTNVG